MADTTAFRIGAEVSCADGVCGEVTRVIVDPVARAVTHLAVDRHGLGRLVPLDLVNATTGGIRLRCTLAEFEQLDSAETIEVLSADDGENPHQGPDQIILPYYSMADRASMHARSVTRSTAKAQVREPSPNLDHVASSQCRSPGRIHIDT